MSVNQVGTYWVLWQNNTNTISLSTMKTEEIMYLWYKRVTARPWCFWCNMKASDPLNPRYVSMDPNFDLLRKYLALYNTLFCVTELCARIGNAPNIMVMFTKWLKFKCIWIKTWFVENTYAVDVVVSRSNLRGLLLSSFWDSSVSKCRPSPTQ